jgi:hypothetical protein
MTAIPIGSLTHLTTPALADKVLVEPSSGLPAKYSLISEVLGITQFIGAGTWAARPTASGNTGKRYWATDIGSGGEFVSNGTDWLPIYAITLARSAVAIPIPNNTLTTVQTYVTITIPAGLMGLNGAIFVEGLWTITASTNVKTMQVRFGASGSNVVSDAVSVGTSVATRLSNIVRNRNSATVQVTPPTSLVGAFSAGTASAVLVPTSVNTASAFDIQFNGTLATTGEVITLESYQVILIP